MTLSLKTVVNVPTKSNKQNKLEKNLNVLKVTFEFNSTVLPWINRSILKNRSMVRNYPKTVRVKNDIRTRTHCF
jgi:hypothetical protein